MIIDITQTYNKQERQIKSDRSYTVDLLKTIIYNNQSVSGLIKANFQNILIDQPVSKGTVFHMVDNDFKNCLLYEANLQFNKALYNWSSYKRLVTNGLWSWAYVTLYYAQFYAINGLINLQGNSFTRPILNVDGIEKEHQLHVYPDDFEDGIFIVESRRLSKPHEDIWRQYYNVYKNFRFKLEEYNELYQYDREYQFDAIRQRNFRNYDISYRFPEYNFTEDEIISFRENLSQDIFKTVDRDEYLGIEYIASLRIRLLFEMLEEILNKESFSEIRSQFNEQRQTMLDITRDDTPVKSNFKSWVAR